MSGPFDRPTTSSDGLAMSIRKQEALEKAQAQAQKEKEYFGMQYGMGVNISSIGKKRGRHIQEDDYLEGEDDDDGPAYQPAPGSPGPETKEESEEDEDDPLDAFMAGVEVQAKKDKLESEHKATAPEEKDSSTGGKDKLGRTDLDTEDMQESYFRWMDEHPTEPVPDDQELVDYDHEGNPIYAKKLIDPLPPVDHSAITYPPFDRNFYTEHADISALSRKDNEQLQKKLGIKVSGHSPPKSVSSFGHFGFDESLMAAIRRAEYEQPTPIQAAAIPAVMSGRDVIGIAKTGSGKTVTYVWPSLIHCLAQEPLAAEDGPVVLICVPTRELALQVYSETRKFARIYNLRTVCAYGGGSKWEQSKALAEGAEIVVGTPGRIIDMVSIGATKLNRVTYLVFDEADRMFDMGFGSLQDIRTSRAFVKLKKVLLQKKKNTKEKQN